MHDSLKSKLSSQRKYSSSTQAADCAATISNFRTRTASPSQTTKRRPPHPTIILLSSSKNLSYTSPRPKPRGFLSAGAKATVYPTQPAAQFQMDHTAFIFLQSLMTLLFLLLLIRTPSLRRHFLHSTAPVRVRGRDLTRLFRKPQTPSRFSHPPTNHWPIAFIQSPPKKATLASSARNPDVPNPSRFDALFIGPGTSLLIHRHRWWLGKPLALIHSRRGRLISSLSVRISSLRESSLYSAEVRAWQEDEQHLKNYCPLR